MVGSYTSLPPGVAATVPRRILLRDSWVKHAAGPPEEAVAEASEPNAAEPPSPPPPSPPPSTRPSLLAREGPRSPPLASPPCLSPDLPRPFERFRSASARESRKKARPASVVLTTYISTAAKDEFQGLSGKVSRTKAFFESSPLQVKDSSGEWDEADIQETDLPPDTLVTYTFKNPLRASPKPALPHALFRAGPNLPTLLQKATSTLPRPQRSPATTARPRARPGRRRK
nr:peptidyl serine alpha-galactosyltransferase-like [Penaeus vannamei]